mmetsp:Transcript_10845/g.30475  ORF Transcript_10845/g.30475 Transcript_10845/m.30475 type:complete len:845 (+) Transcript_10845:136-2670(+)
MPLKVEPFLWDVASHALGGLWGSDSHRLLAEQAEIDDTGHVTDEAYHGDGGGGGGGDGEHHSEFGVHISFDDLYASILFFTFIYVMGAFAQRVLKMPSLVGEIFAGIILGPPVAGWVPNPEAFVMLGEIGLILLVLEAGIDIDVTMLKLIGTRGLIIAIVGSVLPIGIGIAVAFALGVDTKGAIAAGCCFGPTSLGIAMNILRQGKIINTPVGQLIVSAAVIDDMIALIILSLLSALAGPVSVVDLVMPVVSAVLFLGLGGYIALTWFPRLFNRFVLPKVAEEKRAPVELAVMLGLLLGLMPATYYAKASFLMGAFIAGLAFCRSNDLHHIFVRQFKRILQWLMRIFFAASIGFQVPIRNFGDGTVIWQGLVFCVALLGKIFTGFLVPNFNQSRRFTDIHLRDCLITGFSMAAEGEFAFVIAVFAVDSGIISINLYASIVLAVLLSTIIPPFLLRFTISHYNKKAEEKVAKAAEEEFQDEDATDGSIRRDNKEKQLREGIKNDTTVFLCIQTQSESSWGLLTKLMSTMQRLGVEVIDHRSWHPRGVDTTLVNEVFVKDNLKGAKVREDGHMRTLDDRVNEIQQTLLKTINQDVAKVKVSRWFPGVLEEIKEETEEVTSTTATKRRLTVTQTIMKEAAVELEKRKERQTHATKAKTVEEILAEQEGRPAPVVKDESLRNLEAGLGPGALGGGPAEGDKEAGIRRRPRRVRQKMRSTPVVGGGLFDTPSGGTDPAPEQSMTDFRKEMEENKKEGKKTGFKMPQSSGQPAEIIVNGEAYKIRISSMTLQRIRSGYSGQQVEDGSIKIDPSDVPIEYRLAGFVRNDRSLATVTEETEMDDSVHSNAKE